MATIAIYANKINQMPGLIKDVKNGVNNFKSELSALRTKALVISKSVCDLDDVISSVQVSTQIQEQKVDSLEDLSRECEEFVSDVARIDSDVAELVVQRKEEFYDKYYYLKPECEKNGWEKFKDGCKKAADWCKEHWKLLATIVIVVAAIVVVVFFPAAAPVLLFAAKGAIIGALSGGLIGGLSSWAEGGSFWEGFENGAFSGALSGAFFGALGGAGQMVASSCKIMSTFGGFSKVFKVVSLTAKISGGITAVMGGFDTLALVIKLFDPSNPLVAINQTLHSSILYNAFQFSVGVVAAFSGGAYQRMRQSLSTCFVAGTMVLTVSGLVAIENIKAGDKVISTNPKTMETTEKAVLETFVHEVNKLVHLSINDDEIIATCDHPFYVKNYGFINASELWVGAAIVNLSGDTYNIDNICFEFVERSEKVYNFKVQDFHTYYVSKNMVLVHNAECISPPELPPFDKKTVGVLRTADGTEITFESGGTSPYKNLSATHAEGKAAIYLRENGLTEGTLYINNTNGICNYCDKGLPTLLPENATLTVIPPANAVAPNRYWIDVPKTYIGNSNIPTMN